MDQVKIFWLRDKKRFPVACVASLLIRAGEAEESRLVRFATGVYNHADRMNNPSDFPFLQERGKQIALGRLVTGRNKVRLLEIEAGESIKQKIVEEIRDTTIRAQVREACELWLHEAHVKRFAYASSQADGHA